jgi:hypothetical protein
MQKNISGHAVLQFARYSKTISKSMNYLEIYDSFLRDKRELKKVPSKSP